MYLIRFLPDRVAQEQQDDQRAQNQRGDADAKGHDHADRRHHRDHEKGHGLVVERVQVSRRPHALRFKHGVSQEVRQHHRVSRHQQRAEHRLAGVVIAHPDDRPVPDAPDDAQQPHPADAPQVDQLALQVTAPAVFLAKGDDQPQERANDDRVEKGRGEQGHRWDGGSRPGRVHLGDISQRAELKDIVQQRLQAIEQAPWPAHTAARCGFCRRPCLPRRRTAARRASAAPAAAPARSR